MNKHCGRWVFSKIRGCLMVVAEAAKGQGKGGGARGERNRTPVGGASGTVRLVNTLALSAMLTQSLLQPLQAVAQIRADNTAPGAQRPTVLSTGNGLPPVGQVEHAEFGNGIAVTVFQQLIDLAGIGGAFGGLDAALFPRVEIRLNI